VSVYTAVYSYTHPVREHVWNTVCKQRTSLVKM